MGEALELGALHPAQKADIGNSARGAVLLEGGKHVSAAHDQEFDLGAEGRCIHELFGSAVYVDACALQNPYRFVLGKLQFLAQNLTSRLGSVPLAVGRPGQFGLQGHVANQVPGRPVLLGVLLGDAGIDRYAKVRSRNSVALHQAPKSLH